jgi:16S rRNA processing protein RimM
VKLKAASPLAGPEVLVELRGVGSRVVAEALVGAQVAVFREDVPPPEEGQFFFGDLTGLTARTLEGETLGEVAQVFQAGPVPNLVIHAEGKEELMIPFAEDFVRKVDLEAGEIIVVVPVYG